MSSSPWPRTMSPVSSCSQSAADRQRDARLPGEAEADPQVLAMEGDLEAERVLVGDHPAAAVRQDPALGGAARQRLATTCSGSRPAFIASTIPSATPR